MKKGLITILAVAIIGAISLHEKPGDSSAHLVQPKLNSSGSSVMSSNTGTASNNASKGFKDGTYTGATEQTPYGPVEISVVVSGGKITDINFLQMPSDLGHSQEVTAFSEPLLKQETLDKQSTSLDFVSGATTTSDAYVMSLQAALDQAVIS
jgi:uncharacterized protein with FMN-binding domain